MFSITSFRNEWGFLSNFFPSKIVYEGITYPTAEHAFQAAKTLDQDERKRIAALKTPAEAKAAGRRVTLRKDWNSVCLSVMKDIIAQKFAPETINAQRLSSTGELMLIEGNTWNDTFWGVCNGKGENHLGKILMAQRKALNIHEEERMKKAKSFIPLKLVQGNLLQSTSEVIAHCCNCFNTMGAGVALAIKKQYPRAFIVDNNTKKGDRKKLGAFTKSIGTPTIYNLYGQYFYGNYGGKSPIDYNALEKAIVAMKNDLLANNYTGTIALPRLGAGLAGGDWNKIQSIVEKHLCSHWQVTIYSI